MCRPLSEDRFGTVQSPYRMSGTGRYGDLSIAKSVYPTPHGRGPSEPMPTASDKPRWTEPPRRLRAGLLGNVRFRLLTPTEN